MFGYIVPDNPELKIKEYEIFKSYYCGVCKSMGRRFGPLARTVLNYDLVFIGLIWSGLDDKLPVISREACIINPFKKKWIVRENEFVDLAADLNILLTYYKLRDNWHDERKIGSLSASFFLYFIYRQAKAKRPELDQKIRTALQALDVLEKQKCASIDAAAEPFADLMRQILRDGYKGSDQGTIRSLEWLGYNLGKWLYLIDAYDDIEKDARNGSYNPFICQYRYDKIEPADLFKAKLRDEAKFNLTHCLGQTVSAAELLQLNNKPIVDNILYLGLYKKTEIILKLTQTQGSAS